MSKKPNVLEYGDSRRYLEDLVEFLRMRQSDFSFRKFSAAAGLKSSNALSLVISGKRALPLKSFDKFAKGLGLSLHEAHYLKNMVLLERAKTPEKKSYYARILADAKRSDRTRLLPRSQYMFYMNWYASAIRELVARDDFQEDPAWIAKQLSPEIQPQQAHDALEALVVLDMIRRNPAGRLVQTHDMMATEVEVQSVLIKGFHEQMIQIANQSLHRFRGHEREVSASTVLMSQNSFETVKRKIQAFHKELLEIVQHDSAADRVYQVNLQLFPLSAGKGGSSEDA